MKTVEIYTDGACSGNPGAGGYCAILIYNGSEKIISGGERETTNNKMELLAVIKGLEALKETCIVNLYSDSAYVVDAFNKGWIFNWQNNNWRTADKKDVKNKELWLLVFEQYKKHKINFIKVKGHADNYYNNICDKLATDEIKMHKQII